MHITLHIYIYIQEAQLHYLFKYIITIKCVGLTFIHVSAQHHSIRYTTTAES